jgi:hypothetical protein
MSVATSVAEETAKILAREYITELEMASRVGWTDDFRTSVTDMYVAAYLRGSADAIDEVTADYDDLIAGYESKLEELVARIVELEARPGDTQ